MSAFPPLKFKPSAPISQDAALKYLQNYLEKANTAAHLLPNARLEETGVDAGSRNSSLVFHNLQRVEAGLRGEWLAPSLDLEGVKVAGETEVTQDTTEGEGWQDLEEYQREQSIEEGEPEARGVVAANVDSDLQDDVETQEVDATAPATKTLKDKEARKLEKKARHKERQRQKEAVKQQAEE